ncbi:MAG: hypothetical protein V1736_03795 [Pseudomonadota bacterium]
MSTLVLTKGTSEGAVRFPFARRKTRKNVAGFSLGIRFLFGITVLCASSFIFFRSELSKREAIMLATERSSRQLLAENRQLIAEWAYLKSPAHLGLIAKQRLGLRPPSGDQLVNLR